MALTDIQAVRLKTGDKSIINREVARGDGSTIVFKLSHSTILAAPIPAIWVNNLTTVEGVDYTVNYDQGIITFTVAPGNDLIIIFQYYWAVFSDVEIQHFLDEAEQNTTFASSKLLYALAADAAKVAMRETLAGGSSFGSVTKDTALTAQELRETARALYQQYTTEDGGIQSPVDGLTEVAWTEQTWNQLEDQDVIRNLY